jgi:hypothetical protein
MLLAIVPVEPHGEDSSPTATTDVDAAIVGALARAGEQGLSRHALRLTLRIRNQTLSEAFAPSWPRGIDAAMPGSTYPFLNISDRQEVDRRARQR